MSQRGGPAHKPIYDWSWFWKGTAQVISLPSLILISAFIGFGGLAREAGITLGQLIFLVPTIWALPSHLILVSGIAAGAPLLAIVLAVALAAVRMLPMTMALVPEIRMPQSRRWHLLAVSNMVAITAWMHTLTKASTIPRAGRLPFFVGFAGICLPLAETRSARASSQCSLPERVKASAVVCEHWIFPERPVDSMRAAVFTVSPNN